MKNVQTIFTGSSTRHLYKPEPTTDGFGTKAEPIGVETFDYVVEVDMDTIHAMAHRAAANKNGRAIRGPILVKVTNRR